ncbi:DNRLRE domain-containing protein [Paenibacillus sp. VT-400]|uniref:DNRLRE domain-containing protein n=1 Tax=Paenibacillus sp. VT-400 TaxID=1495853 RepID=UPI000649AECE|nr:DNRLRE domain-containing protein [Paenibacillus sp. VT-400]
MARNRMKGKVILNVLKNDDLASSVSPRIHNELLSSVLVRTHNKMTGQVLVIGNTDNDMPSIVQPRLYNDLLSSVKVRPHSKMSGLVEIMEPPAITVRLSPIEDTYARQDMPKLNYGYDHDTFVGAKSNGQLYRTFMRYDISSIPKDKKIKSVKLKLHLLNSLPAIPIAMYDVAKGEKWNEYGLTWDNQPAVRDLIKTYDGGTYAGETDVDLLTYVTEWYEGKRQHNGFSLRALSEAMPGRFKQYGTRESDLTPVLEITYFDPTVYSYNRSELRSSVYVVGLKDYDLVSSIVVAGYAGEYYLNGSVTVRDPKTPVRHEIPSSVAVNRNYLPSSVFVMGTGEKEINASVSVRVGDGDGLVSSVIVNRRYIDGEVYVKPHEDMDSTVVVKGKMEDDSYGSVIVNAPNREGSVYVRPYSDLSTTLTIRSEDYDELYGSVIVSVPEREGSVYVRSYTDLDGFVNPRIMGDDWLSSSVFVISEIINSLVIVRQSDVSDMLSFVFPRVPDKTDLDGSVISKVPKDSDLPSSVAIRNDQFYDLDGSVIPCILTASDIPSNVEVEIASNLSSSVTVRAWLDSDIPSSVGVRYGGEHEIKSSVTVRALGYRDIDCSVTVRVQTDTDIRGSVQVRGEQLNDLLSIVKPRVAGAEDLPCTVDVSGDVGYAFIM